MHLIQFTIKAGHSLSDTLRLNGATPVLVRVPSGWTAASLAFVVNGAPLQTLDGAAEYAAAVAATKQTPLQSGLFLGADTLQLRSGTSAAAVAQVSEIVVDVYCIAQGAAVVAGGAVTVSMPAVASAVKISPTGGSKTVTAAGTAEALVAVSTKRTSLYVRAKATNTGNVYVGDSSVDKTTSQQIILAAGQSVTIAAPGGYCIDVNEFYVDADVNAEGVDFLYV